MPRLHMDAEIVQPAVDAAPGWRDRLRALREILLANTIMAGEIPAPTGEEAALARFLVDRFTESGLQNISTDEEGNAAAILPGSRGERRILVVAHMDTVWNSTVDHTVSVSADAIRGPGVADNSLGVATLANLPHILEHLGVTLQSDLLLLGTTRSMGPGDLRGLRFFLESTPLELHSAICVEGTELGRLSHTSLGMIRLKIELTSPEDQDWTPWQQSGALVAATHLVQGILAIERPEQPRTSIVLGSLHSGTGYASVPHHALLRVEVKSEQPGMVSRVHAQIEELVAEVRAHHKVQATVNTVARRKPAALPFGHPLVRTSRRVMEVLGIQPTVDPSTGELAALLDRGIPAVTIGLTHGEFRHELEETIHIEPIFTGLAQLVAILQATDALPHHEQD